VLVVGGGADISTFIKLVKKKEKVPSKFKLPLAFFVNVRAHLHRSYGRQS